MPGSILTVFLSTLFMAAIASYSYQNLSQGFNSQFERIGRLFVESITNPLLLGQDEVVYRACKMLQSGDSVLSVRIERASGQTICDLGSADLSGPWRKVFSESVLFDPSGNETAAQVEIVFALTALRTQMLYWLIFGLLMALMFVFGQGWLYRRLAKQVAEPIARVSHAVAAGNAALIAEGQWRAPTRIREIDLLNTKIVEMADNLTKSQAELVLRERDRASAELARQIAHDIRSPLSALKIMRDKTMKDHSELNSLMGNAIDRIEFMAEDMLTRSRKQSHAMSIAEANQTVSDLLNEFRFKSDQKGVRLSVRMADPAAGSLTASGSDLKRVLNNLLDNALDVSNAGMEIRCELSVENGFWRVAIEDRGPGLSPEMVVQLREGTVKSTKPGGNGLGLAHAQKTVASWSGTMEYQRVEPTGARFVITLPLI